jgi:hypothetical protein
MPLNPVWVSERLVNGQSCKVARVSEATRGQKNMGESNDSRRRLHTAPESDPGTGVGTIVRSCSESLLE